MDIPARTVLRPLVWTLVALNVVGIAYLSRRWKEGPLAWLAGRACVDGRRVPALSGSSVFIAVHREGYTLDYAGLVAAAHFVPSSARFLVLTNSESPGLGPHFARPGAFIVDTNLASASRRLGMPPGLDRWVYVSAGGVVLASSNLSSGDIANIFGRRTQEGRKRAGQALKGVIERLNSSGAFDAAHQAAARVPGGILNVLFVNYACSGCAIADGIHRFQAAAGPDLEAYRIEVPPSWSSLDRRVLAANFGVRVRISTMSKLAAQALSEFNAEFGALNSNGFVVCFDAERGFQLREALP